MSLRIRPLVWCALLGPAFPLAAEQKPPLDAPVLVGHSGIRMVKTLDLNGDGWIDAIGWWPLSATQSRMYAVINDGTGKLVPSTWALDFPSTTTIVDAHDATDTGDLDEDGKEDFVFSNRTEVRIYLSNGAGVPTLFTTVPYPYNVHGVVLSDFDLDGHLDLAVNANETLQIRRFDFTTSTAPLVSEYVTSYLPDGRLVAAELTGDGTPDLLVGGTRIYPVSAGVIQAPAVYVAGWAYDPTVSLRHDVGDIDGDGDLDVVTFRVATGETAQYRVLRRTGGSSFVEEAPRAGGPARRLFDLDADGDLDGTCCGGGGGSASGNIAASNFRLSFNDGTGNFAPSIDITGLGSTAIAGVEDVDHDGNVDLVAGRCVYYGNGPITDTPFTPIGSLQNERTLHDFDVEGDPDFDFRASWVRVNLGDGAHVIRSHVLPPAPNGFTRWGDGLPGDWDGDGVVDTLVLLGSPWSPDGLELLRNVGGGTFESKGVVAGPTGLIAVTPQGDRAYAMQPRDSLAKDLDGDGDQDLVLRTRTQELNGTNLKWSCWLRNNGASGFAFVEDFPNLVVLDAADLNGDGIVDLFGVLATGTYPWPERWAAGLGGGAWAAWTVIAGTSLRPVNPPDQVQIVDVDLDGDLDLVHAYSLGQGSTLQGRVHLNDGAGTFVQDPTGVNLNGTSGQPGCALAADLNSDGLVDVVFGTTGTNQAAILMRKADNTTWDPPIDQVIFAEQYDFCLTSRDPDGDRDADVITSRIVKNRLYEGTPAGSRRQAQDGQYGQDGIVPTLGASGPFRVGMVARLRLRGARPGVSGALHVSDASSMPLTFGPMTSANHRLTRFVTFTTSGTATDPAGSGAWLETYTVPAIYAGRTFRYQVVLDDPAGSNGHSRSNSLLLSYGW